MAEHQSRVQNMLPRVDSQENLQFDDTDEAPGVANTRAHHAGFISSRNIIKKS